MFVLGLFQSLKFILDSSGRSDISQIVPLEGMV